MLAFLVRRLLSGATTIVLASFALFSLMHLLPGDEVRALLPATTIRVPPDLYASLLSELHLDRPFLVQYGLFLRDLVTLDFGSTMPRVVAHLEQVVPGDPLRPLVLGSLRTSGGIVGGVLALELLLAPVVVWVAARRRDGPLDHVSRWTSVVLVSVPVLVAAILVQTTMSYWTDLSPTPVWSSRGTWWQNLLPPVASLGLGAAAHVALVGREEVLAVLAQQHARFARALGLPESHVVRRALRPTAGAMAQVLATNVAAVGTGLIIVEDVFKVPGIGSALLAAIHDQDRTLIVTLLVVVLALAVVASTVADIAHGLLDPRVRDRVLAG